MENRYLQTINKCEKPTMTLSKMICKTFSWPVNLHLHYFQMNWYGQYSTGISAKKGGKESEKSSVIL